MKYYLFSAEYPNDSLSVTGREVGDSGSDRCDIRRCEPLESEFLKCFDFQINQRGVEYDLLANNMSWCIVEAGVRSVLQNACSSKELQFLPFDVFQMEPGGLPGKSYFLLNILEKIDCIDTAKSELRYDSNDIGKKYISSVCKLRLRSDRIPRNSNIFRLKNLEGYIIVNEIISSAIGSLKPIACSFTLLE